MTDRAERWTLPCVLLLCVGCAAHRTLTVESTPPGATLRIDDRIVGTTPYTEEFYDYGTRRLTLYKEGYHSLSQVVALEPRWYARFPIDVLSEVVVPWGWKDPHTVHVDLEAVKGSVTEPDLDAVLGRAQALRMAGPDGPSLLPSRMSARATPVPRPPHPQQPHP